MLVTVQYGRLDAAEIAEATRCGRCEGKGRAPISYLGPVGTCTVCDGSGVYVHGYAYDAGALPVKIGDVVEVPRTEFSKGLGPNLATVVRLGSDYTGWVSPVLRVLSAEEAAR